MIKKLMVLAALTTFFALPAAAQDEEPAKKRAPFGEILGGDAEKKKETPKYSYLYDTSLIRAIKTKDLDRVNLLLFANINPNEKNDEGYTPLVIAAQTDFPVEPYLVTMLQRDAKVNLPSVGGLTPLMAAAEAGNLKMIKLFLEYGADPSMQDDNKQTALFYAVMKKQLAVIPLFTGLKRSGIEERNTDNLTPFLYAFKQKDLPTMKALAKAGANVDAKDNFGKTPLMIAVDEQNQPMAAELLALGAKKEEKDNAGRTALAHAVQIGNRPLLKYLVDQGADIEAKDLVDTTPLLLGVKQKDTLIAQDLVAAGANYNAKDKLDRTSIIWAVENNDNKTLNMLLTLPKINLETLYGDNKVTPIILAAKNKNLEGVVSLVKAGALIDSKDSAGETALFYSTRAGDIATASFLIKSGAEANTENAKGEEPVDIARADKNAKLATILAMAPIKIILVDKEYWQNVNDIDAYIKDLETLLIDAKQLKGKRDGLVQEGLLSPLAVTKK